MLRNTEVSGVAYLRADGVAEGLKPSRDNFPNSRPDERGNVFDDDNARFQLLRPSNNFEAQSVSIWCAVAAFPSVENPDKEALR